MVFFAFLWISLFPNIFHSFRDIFFSIFCSLGELFVGSCFIHMYPCIFFLTCTMHPETLAFECAWEFVSLPPSLPLACHVKPEHSFLRVSIVNRVPHPGLVHVSEGFFKGLLAAHQNCHDKQYHTKRLCGPEARFGQHHAYLRHFILQECVHVCLRTVSCKSLYITKLPIHCTSQP